MRRVGSFVAALAVLALLAPGLANARAGDGASMGSRGSRSFSAPPPTSTSPYASPLQRSMTPQAQPGPSAPLYGGVNRPAFGGGFMSGLMGGLIGAGIGGLLFGHGLFGGIGGLSSLFGLLLQIALVVFVVRFLWRRFGGAATPLFAPAGLANLAAPGAARPAMGGGMAAPGGFPPLVQADFAAFERSLKEVQAAWSTQDLATMRRLVTPEMLSYFNDQLAEQASRGVRNSVSDIRLNKGDLSETWGENGRQYATVAMQFSMIDVTRDGAGRVLDGSLTEHVTATEFWTFMRVPGGNWVLSAIQQGK